MKLPIQVLPHAADLPLPAYATAGSAGMDLRATEDATVYRGDRIAQLVIAPVARAVIVEGEVVADTARGAGGLGSSGR